MSEAAEAKAEEISVSSITDRFEAAYDLSPRAVVDFMRSGDEQYNFALDYFSRVRNVKVNTKYMNVVCVDGREFDFVEPPPKGIQEVIAQNVPRVISKGCNTKFNAFLASFQNLEYLYCQFRTKNIRDRLAYEFNVDDAVLDVRGQSFQVLSELRATCGIVRLYKAEDCLTKINSLSPGLTFPAIKEIHTFADFAKAKNHHKQLEAISAAIANVPKLFPQADYTSLVFNLGEFAESENIDEFIKDVIVLFEDAADDKTLHVGCIFCHVKRGNNFNRDGWSFYNYNLQAKKEVKISPKKTLDMIIDPRNGPKKFARTLALEHEEQNGNLVDQWYDEIHNML